MVKFTLTAIDGILAVEVNGAPVVNQVFSAGINTAVNLGFTISLAAGSTISVNILPGTVPGTVVVNGNNSAGAQSTFSVHYLSA